MRDLGDALQISRSQQSETPPSATSTTRFQGLQSSGVLWCGEGASRRVDRALVVAIRWFGGRRRLQLQPEAVLETAVTTTLVLQVVEPVDELDGVHAGVPFSVLHAVERGVA